MLVEVECSLDAPFLRSSVAVHASLHFFFKIKGGMGLKVGVSEVSFG